MNNLETINFRCIKPDCECPFNKFHIFDGINKYPMADSPVRLKLNYKFWIETDSGESIMGEGKWILLKNIRDTGSLKAAVEKMGYTYRQTWGNLKNIEEKIGFRLIEKSRGGAKGGHTVLTQKGENIVAFFEKFYNQVKPAIEIEIAEMQNELNRIMK